MSKSTVFEDDEDWLLSYLATTEYGKDPRLNSKPAPTSTTTHAKPKGPKKRFSLNLQGGPSSRRVASVTDASHSSGGNLPERVNVIRDDEGLEEETNRKHFVRYHSENNDVVKEANPVKHRRRETLDYDELDAVRER